MSPTRKLVSGATVAAVVAGIGLVVTPAQAAKPVRIPDAQQERILPRKELAPATVSPRRVSKPDPVTAVRWPERAVELSPNVSAEPLGLSITDVDAVDAADVGGIKAAPQPRSLSRRLGVSGPVFALESTSDINELTLGVDPARFGELYGAGWDERLVWRQFPVCALSTPGRAECRQGVDLDHAKPASATGPTSPDPMVVSDVAMTDATGSTARSQGVMSQSVVALTSEPAGAGGNFTASDLKPSGSWSAGGSTGAFTWSYAVDVPDPATGSSVVPQIALAYNSQAVDGQNSMTNNQASWVGQGFSYNPGFIERSYQPCDDVLLDPKPENKADSCYAGEVLTLSLPGGMTTSLVRDDPDPAKPNAPEVWRTQSDEGYRIERKTGANNGDHQGTYWEVTATDGTVFTFGRNRLPGSEPANATNSVQTMPVFHPRSSDPCHADERCTMGFRWNLDLVEDTHGNAAVYSYAQEKNHYKSQGADDALLEYVRAASLTSIRYGLSTSDGSGLFAVASHRVDFDLTERCVPFTDQGGVSYTCSEADFRDKPAAWRDVPADQFCGAAGECTNYSPTFWTRKKLAAIKTSHWDGSNYQTIDEFRLAQSFRDTELVLDKIQHIAHDGSASASSPPVILGYLPFANHVGELHGMPQMLAQRLVKVETETGQILEVKYAGEQGQTGRAKPLCTEATIPTSPSQNTTSCYPVKWTPPGHTDPLLDYFHKYVVTEVVARDKANTSPPQPTTYTYVGNPAWHYDDNELVRAKYRTWGQFRGYGQVDVRSGDTSNNVVGSTYGAANDKQTLTSNFYLRGMDGDKLPSGSRNASVTASNGTVITDSDQYAGTLYETKSFDGSGGALVERTVTEPQTVATTATRARDGVADLVARMVKTKRVNRYVSLAAGGDYVSTTTTTYDTTGRPLTLTTSGDRAKTRCVETTYVADTAAWIRNKASQVDTFAGSCSTGDLINSKRTFYDNLQLGQVSKGAVTREQESIKTGEWATSETTYDTYGRPRTSTQLTPDQSPVERTTTTSYVPAGRGSTREITTTLPIASQSTTQYYEPARGLLLKERAVDGTVTEADYDTFGRLVAVWKPGQTRGVDPATEKYAYVFEPGRPLAVTTHTLVDPGAGQADEYRSRIVLFDAFGSVRQAQLEGPGGTLAITDNFSDSHGWPVKNYDHWTTTGAPTTNLLGGVNESMVDGWKATHYDGMGRPVKVTGRSGASTVTGEARTIYGGDRVTVLPPVGGITYQQVTDALGNKIATHQYVTSPTVTGNSVTGGTLQSTFYTYDAAGREVTRVAAGGQWDFVYDMRGLRTSMTAPSTGTRLTAYYNSGEIKSNTDAREETVTYKYDALGRMVSKHNKELTNPPLATWEYDTLKPGLPTAASVYDGGKEYKTAVTGYDAASRPLGSTVTLDEPGLNASYTTEMSYTDTGLTSTMTLAGSRTAAGQGVFPEQLTHSYDGIGNLMTMRGINVYLSTATYNAYGEAAQYVLGVNDATASLTFTRDPESRRITSMAMSGQTIPAQLQKFGYTYDQAGNVTKMVETRGGGSAPPTQTNCYRYDNLRQMNKAWSSNNDCATVPASGSTGMVGGPTPYATEWTFDSYGNRTSQKNLKVGSMTADQTLTFTNGGTGYSRHQVSSLTMKTGTTTNWTRSYEYDASGNVKTRVIGTRRDPFTYGPNGDIDTITTPTGVTKYIRDANGKILLRKETPSGGSTKTTLYLPGQEVQSTVAPGATTATNVSVNRYYAVNGTTIATRLDISAIRYIAADIHGTGYMAVAPTANWSVTRRTLDPYGVQLGNTTPTGATFPGGHGFLDKPVNTTAGVTEIGARLYEPLLGRFLSVDPILDADDPQQNQGYSYANNNPTTFSDPSGLLALADGASVGAHKQQDRNNREWRKEKQDPNWNPAVGQPQVSYYDGVRDGLKEGGQELLDAVNPAKIYEGVQAMAKMAIESPIKFAIEVGRAALNIDLWKSVWNAFRSGNAYEMGRVTAKLIVDIGGVVAATLLGVGAARLFARVMHRMGKGRSQEMAANTATGAESALSGARLSTHLRQAEKYGQDGFRELESGRFRYYGILTPASKHGEMAGRRLVREWDPASNATRTWHETLDHSGNVRVVRPETGGPKVHHGFDASGNYEGSW